MEPSHDNSGLRTVIIRITMTTRAATAAETIPAATPVRGSGDSSGGDYTDGGGEDSGASSGGDDGGTYDPEA